MSGRSTSQDCGAGIVATQLNMNLGAATRHRCTLPSSNFGMFIGQRIPLRLPIRRSVSTSATIRLTQTSVPSWSWRNASALPPPLLPNWRAIRYPAPATMPLSRTGPAKRKQLFAPHRLKSGGFARSMPLLPRMRARGISPSNGGGRPMEHIIGEFLPAVPTSSTTTSKLLANGSSCYCYDKVSALPAHCRCFSWAPVFKAR